jgi:hypothetical protein
VNLIFEILVSHGSENVAVGLLGVMPCGLLCMLKCFGGMYCLLLQG